MKIQYGTVCEIGNCRLENQDSVFAKTGDGWGIFLVADGMGGHRDGAWASSVITEKFADWTEKIQGQLSEAQLPFLFDELRRTLGEANDEIFRHTKENGLSGSTVVLLLIVQEYYVLLSVGDSRCYELRKQFLKASLRQMTTDEICETSGDNYGKLTNAVGARMPLRCKLVSGTVNKKHTFFLCSDGIYKSCTEEELLKMVLDSQKEKREETEEKIKTQICAKGAEDNFSAIFVSIVK